MAIIEAIKIVKEYNKWRRNVSDIIKIEMPNPTQLGIAIEIVIKYCEEQMKESAKFTGENIICIKCGKIK